MFLYSAVSSPSDRSTRFTLHSPADLLIPTPTRLLWEAFSHAAIIARRLITHISTTVYSLILMHTAECTGASWRDGEGPSFETATKDIRIQALSIERDVYGYLRHNVWGVTLPFTMHLRCALHYITLEWPLIRHIDASHSYQSCILVLWNRSRTWVFNLHHIDANLVVAFRGDYSVLPLVGNIEVEVGVAFRVVIENRFCLLGSCQSYILVGDVQRLSYYLPQQ